LESFGDSQKYHLRIARSDLETGIPILDLLALKTDIFPSKGEARRMIQNNGLSLNQTKITDPDHTVTPDALLNNKFILIQKGKKNHYLLHTE
jgi:tyrosyl-tRNA synthetase